MIKNEREYKVTKTAVARFRDALAAHQAANHAGRDPVSVQAEASAIQAQLEDLEAAVADYDRLASGGIEALEVSRVEDLPKLLIQARIASGLTHEKLAERLGVKPQQIQRWEDDDYQTASFWRLIEVAEALGLSFSITASLPQPSAPSIPVAVDKLKAVGIDKGFLTSRLVPPADEPAGGAERSTHDCAQLFASRVEAIFGKPFQDLVAINDDDPWWGRAVANARYKLGATAKEKPVAFYSAYAHFLASALCRTMRGPVDRDLPLDWRAMRTLLFRDGRPDLAMAVRRTWELGIPVLPLCDKGTFHGACWRIDWRGAVVLKQPMQTASRWLFDLVHELYHLAEAGPCQEFAAIEADGTSDGRRLADEELRAHAFAADVLLNGKADVLYEMVSKEAKGRMAWVKGAVQKVAAAEGVGVGLLANLVAFRLGQEKDENWWGAAKNLQADDAPPYDTVRQILLQAVDLNAVEEPAGGLLRQAVAPLAAPSRAGADRVH
ncbi:MAG TPA: helix-turn-helix transcriptional regulator [Azospirillum sp.]